MSIRSILSCYSDFLTFFMDLEPPVKSKQATLEVSFFDKIKFLWSFPRLVLVMKLFVVESMLGLA